MDRNLTRDDQPEPDEVIEDNVILNATKISANSQAHMFSSSLENLAEIERISIDQLDTKNRFRSPYCETSEVFEDNKDYNSDSLYFKKESESSNKLPSQLTQTMADQLEVNNKESYHLYSSSE